MLFPLKDVLRNLGNRRKLAYLLVDYPLFLVLLYSIWFRIAVVLMFVFVLALGLCWPRMWRTSPAGFLPVVRTSLIDLAQAWALKHSALRAAAAGRTDDAMHAWQSALANNPADPDLLRGVLQFTLQTPSRTPPPYAINQTFWLLRLTQTNATDLDLVARVYDQFHLDEYSLALLEPQRTPLSPAAERILAKALFNAGRMDVFARRFEKHANEWASDPELRLYRAAYQVGWGKPDRAAEGRAILDAAKQDPAQQKLAYRLQLAISAHFADSASYRQALLQLGQWRADNVLDHVAYWQLLMLEGRKSEAVKLAQAFSDPPQTAPEAVRLAEEYAALGLREQAGQVAQTHLDEFGYAPKLWQIYADLLMEDHQWETLQGLALRMRQDSSVRNRLESYSYYLEGRAQLAQDRKPLAEAAFRKATELPFEDPNLGLAIASQLQHFQYSEFAVKLLTQFEAPFKGYLPYWSELFDAAFSARQPDLLLKAATRAHDLQPDDIRIMNNYAATLITLRTRPEEAVRLTVQLAAKQPNSLDARINHALALLLNERVGEAEDLLKSIRTNELQPLEATAYYMGWFQVHYARKNSAAAQDALKNIDQRFLFPNEIEWLKSAEQKLTSSKANSASRG